MSDKRRLLVVDDEPDIGVFICDVAIEMGFDAIAVHLPNTFERVYSGNFDVVILDLVMPERDGVELLRFMADQNSSALIILMSGYDAGVLHSAQKLALERGLRVISTLAKPILYEGLKELLHNLPRSLDNHSMDASGLAEAPTEQELHKAITHGELEVYYQPKVDIPTGSLVGVEALVRWHHPERGLLMPRIIIPLANRAGRMDALTLEVLEQSFKQASKWLKSGLYTKVAVNMASCSFKDLTLPEWVEAKNRQYHLQPGQIAFEVTETTLMRELVKSLDILTRLRMKKVELSIDDFGTGYSSLTQLYRIPFSEMKIDRSFIMHATTDAEALAIVKMTIMLGHELGMTVVAEGVETRETWDLLSEIGCDVAQGYFIARPMPADDLTEWIINRIKKIP